MSKTNNERLVYVGGAMAGVYATDLASVNGLS